MSENPYILDRINVIPVVMAGGLGRRLWPLSSEASPKQFHRFASERTLLQNTLSRLQQMVFPNPIILCHRNHQALVNAQLANTLHKTLLVEPWRRGTATSATLAALHLQSAPDTLMLLCPADHIITEPAKLRKAIAAAVPAALHGAIVTFGITATHPHTGYGYIQQGAAYPHAEGCFHIAQFIEKPNLTKATQYLSEGGYFWNSGMFLCTPETWLRSMAVVQPKTLALCENALNTSILEGSEEAPILHPNAELLQQCPILTIDTAVMEQVKHGAVVPLNTGWSDIGNWQAVWQRTPAKDAHQNVLEGSVQAYHVQHSYLRAEGIDVKVLGLDNVSVIATPNGVLVAANSHLEQLKEMFDDE